MWSFLKKNSIILVLSVTCSFFTCVYADIMDHDNRDKEICEALAISAIIGLGVKIKYDLSWHEHYCQSSKNHYAYLEQSLSCLGDNVSDKLKALCTYDNCFDVVTLVKNIRNSYASFLKPWNWSRDQKQAFNTSRVVLICMLSVYLQGIQTSKERVRILSALFKNNMYTSLLEFIDIMQGTCNFVRAQAAKNEKSIVFVFAHNCVQTMQDVMYDVMVSDEYFHQIQYQKAIAASISVGNRLIDAYCQKH